ncbi:MAG: hypothetical protein AB7F09_11105 [Parvibaculaceae bacterium]
MAQFTHTVTIENRPFKVIIDAPDGASITNVQELAEAAWRSVNRRATIGGATIRVEPA